MAKQNEFSWKTRGNKNIYAYRWDVEDAKAVICLVHGLGEHLHRYDHMVAYYNEGGFSVMSFDNIGNVTDINVLYRLIYSYIDPWIRAFVLSKVIYEMSGYITEMPSVQQDSNVGLTFHFMHDEFRELACSKIFNMEVKKI